MLRLGQLQSKSQIRSLIKSRPLQLNIAGLSSSTKKIVATAICTTAHQQKSNYIRAPWKTTAILIGTTAAYGLINNNVHALESNDCKRQS
jgi:hypothetical protein